MRRPPGGIIVVQHKLNLAQLAFDRFRGGLQRYLMRRLDNAENARDLAQEVYLRLLRVDATELVRQPQSYMYRIASHVVYEFKLREERERECLTINSEVLAELAEQMTDLPGAELWQQVNTERDLEALLARLPPVEQAIVLLRKRDGLAYEQVAGQLNLSVHTVKKYLFRALLRLRQIGWEGQQT
jgi:RNA polymerase sigma-70 factor (ECF subfamily)